MKTRFKYISFQEPEFPGNHWDCYNNKSGAVLGSVQWYQAWKQWVFEAEPDCVFSASCLVDIQTFMEGLPKV